MRRGLASLLFVVGGFCVGMQVMMAFVAGAAGIADDLGQIAYFTAIAAPFLAAGTWLSPGRRWRELGVTMLIGALIVVACFTVVLFLPDENGFTLQLEAVPPGTLLPGFANLALLLTAGLLLAVRGGDYAGGAR